MLFSRFRPAVDLRTGSERPGVRRLFRKSRAPLRHHPAARSGRRALHGTVQTLLENPFDFVPLTPQQEWRGLEDMLQKEPRLWDYVLHRGELTPETSQKMVGGCDIPAQDRSQRFMESVAVARDWVAGTLVHQPDEISPIARWRRSLRRAVAVRRGSLARYL